MLTPIALLLLLRGPLSPGEGAAVRDDRIGSFGWAVECAGDVNRDGVPDLAVGAPTADRVWVFSGLDYGVIHAWRGARRDGFGYAVCRIGDVDGGGVEDIAVGAPFAETSRGYVRVFSAETGDELSTFRGESASGRFGSCVSSSNSGEGFLAIGAPGHPRIAGVVVLFDAVTLEYRGALRDDHVGALYGAAIETSLNVDGDDVPDIAVGAPGFASAEGEQRGAVFVLSGASLGVLHRLDGEADGDRFGAAIAGLPRGAGDSVGAATVLVGAPGWSLPDAEHCGRAYAFDSKTWQPRFVRPARSSSSAEEPKAAYVSSGAQLGTALAPFEDCDGDGAPDFLATAVEGCSGQSAGFLPTGIAEVLSGRTGERLRVFAPCLAVDTGSSYTLAWDFGRSVCVLPRSEQRASAIVVGGPSLGRAAPAADQRRRLRRKYLYAGHVQIYWGEDSPIILYVDRESPTGFFPYPGSKEPDGL